MRPPLASYHHIPEEKRQYRPIIFTGQFNPSKPTDIHHEQRDFRISTPTASP
ncbi:uncharacterized protein BO96DRAFT_406435 [Aspergillus niger CBS 101883]|uniref:uncharacterized protein n=1 Tax=Aspergillus lacticoffeatus (strain CBS 101883) TaxID=1450533 RepID=UPI000D7EF01C|nr:uncharacterized protein BO96DRAFT_406435 [Aspergillus niger CBS 101883]PYH50181.1 hypothetical protein BO96DRAFT_406435 [Aspergillus niger CBS 101883]